MLEDYFGERVAERYDERYAYQSDPAVVDPIVAFLAALARDGNALELGIGTGRIALPLAQRGVRVHGIDLSEAMVARLRAKPGAEQIGVTIGDFATTRVDGKFTVAYLVYNTIQNLTREHAARRSLGEELGAGGSAAAGACPRLALSRRDVQRQQLAALDELARDRIVSLNVCEVPPLAEERRRDDSRRIFLR